ncbi:MAG: phosphatase PAP2 family protein [bacterium]
MIYSTIMDERSFSTFILVLLVFSLASAGVHIVPDLPKLAVKDGASLLMLPIHFSKWDWLYVGIGASMTFSSISIDGWARDEINRGRPQKTSFLIKLADAISSPYVLFGLPLCINILGEMANSDGLCLVGIEGIEVVMLSIGYAYVMKFIIGRDRPSHSKSPFHFCGPHTFSDKHLSMPSLQTTAFSALATVIAERANFPPLTDIAFLSIGAVGISRVWHNEHWASDVILGGLLGYAIGRFIVRRHNEDKEIKDRINSNIEL